MTKKAPPKKCPDCGRFLQRLDYHDENGKLLGTNWRCVEAGFDGYNGLPDHG